MVEGQEVLVEVTRIEGVPCVELGDHREVAEPVVLQRLPEVARRVSGHVAAHRGDALELCAATGIGGHRGSLSGQGGVALGKENHRVAGDVHGREGLAAVEGLGLVPAAGGHEPGPEIRGTDRRRRQVMISERQ